MAPRLKAANLAKTTLASPCSAASTTITVSSSAGFPEPPFRIFVGSERVAYEIMEVTAVNGNTWTVIRGLEGTQVGVWEAGTSVENRFTAGTFLELAKSPHADEHKPGGADALPTGMPANITPGASASAGTAQAFARADHVHATPSTWPPSAHAATHESGGTDAINPNNIGANWNLLVNKPSSFPPSSHATSHRPGGTDALPTGAPTAITVGSTASEGTSTSFARADHVHATPSTWPPSAHASSHQPGGADALPTGTPSEITIGATSSEGTSQAFARADHVHATPSTWPPSAHASSHEEGGSDALNPANLGANWNKIVNKPEAYPPEHHARSHEIGGSDALNPENIGANWNRLVNKPSAFPPEAHAASHESGGADAINPSNIGANWNLLVNKPSSFPPESHASSHQPGGSDALPTGIPSQITVGATSSEGTSQAFARADHVHATPDTWPPTPHASLHEEGGSDALNPANLGANWNKIINKPEAYPPEYHATSHEAGGSDALNPNNIGANWDLLVNKPNTFPPEAHSANHIPGGTDALPTGSPSSITPGSTSSEGTASSFARSDHVHATPETWPPSAHASSHQSGGADELNVDGLQGVLADFQKAKIGVIANKADFPLPGIQGRLAWAQDEQTLYQDTGTAWVKIAPYTFLELSDTPGTYSGQGGKVVRVKTSEDGLEFVSVVEGAARFTELEDTPSSYSGQALKYVRVKSDETGLEFTSAVGGAGNFLELSDTPSSYSGAGGKYVRVKTDETGLEFVPEPGGGAASFLELNDTPSSYTGYSGYAPVVKATEDGLAWAKLAGATTGNTTLYVDATNGSDTTGDGSASNPFATIQKAIDWFKTNCPFIIHDVKICVGRGTYVLSEPLNLSGLNILGTFTIEACDTNGNALYDRGTATGGSSSTLTDSTKNWPVNFWQGGKVFIYRGTGAGQWRTISSNTSTTLTVSSNWNTTPDSTSVYVIVLPTIDGATNGLSSVINVSSIHNVAISGFHMTNPSNATTYVIATVGCFGWRLEHLLITGGRGIAFTGGRTTSFQYNCINVGSYALYVGYGAGITAYNCVFVAATAGSGLGAYVVNGGQYTQSASTSLKNTYVNWNIGTQAYLGGVVLNGSAQNYIGCTTNYTPVGATDPAYIS